ncbi:hypothetical protein BpHYR1_032423 [Brachionus plicatilis]|uniref:Uncharacterized protein n=1 Tax=Brachionus plicatilis TaxID=10195 RepID=A0A3M7T2F8_BRAPC|nr:hypothetical protein BpHYR1_032423 [Brachionus plicatilis]
MILKIIFVNCVHNFNGPNFIKPTLKTYLKFSAIYLWSPSLPLGKSLHFPIHQINTRLIDYSMDSRLRMGSLKKKNIYMFTASMNDQQATKEMCKGYFQKSTWDKFPTLDLNIERKSKRGRRKKTHPALERNSTGPLNVNVFRPIETNIEPSIQVQSATTLNQILSISDQKKINTDKPRNENAEDLEKN